VQHEVWTVSLTSILRQSQKLNQSDQANHLADGGIAGLSVSLSAGNKICCGGLW
jgi:hypothetical protein